ncbi:MAG: hypothetical protein K8F30_10945, partial [Taibaiella sp.]|nr:hypothetical protein [Taibaiella sp.]
GSFENQLFLGGVTLSGAGGSDVIIAKYSHAGDLLWERTISGPGNEKGATIAVDSHGSVFVSGTFEGAINLHGSTITSLGETDLFIACYSQAGDFLWVRTAGSLYDDNVRDMVTSPKGGVYVGGQFAETDIYPVPDEVWGYFGDDSLLAEKGGEIFLLNCLADGNIAWAKAIGGFGNNAQLHDVSVDGHGNVNIGGTFSSYIKMGNLLIVSKSSGYINGEIFVAKLNNNGHPLWVNTIYGYNIPGGGKGGAQPGIISGGMIATDNEGSVVVTGKFEGCELMLPPYQVSDKGWFMVKYGPGGEAVWLKSGDFASPYSVQRLTCNKRGDVFIAGTVGQPGIKVGNDILDALGGGNVFVGKYDRDGNEIWGNIIKGDGLDTPRALAIAGDDRLYLAGTYRSSELNFSGHKISSYLNSTAADIFVAAFHAF